MYTYTYIYIYIHIHIDRAQGIQDSILIACEPQRRVVSTAFAIARGGSPTWHRRLRSRRAVARQVVKRLRNKPRLSGAQTGRFIRSLDLLQGHHTCPRYRISTLLKSSLSRSMSKRWTAQKAQSNPWPGWSPQWPKTQKPKGGQGKGQGPSEGHSGKSKDGLPLSYSSMPSAGPQAVEDQGAQAFMQAFLRVVQDGKAQIPEALQPYLPDPEREDLKSQQKMLNKIRNNRQKIQAKEKALARDEFQWKQWLEEVRSVIENQKRQHLENQEKLQKELKDLLQEQDKLRKMKEQDAMEVSEDEHAGEEENVENYVDKLLSSAAPKEDPKQLPDPGQVEQQALQTKFQEMQDHLNQDFQWRLQQAQAEMEARFQKQLLQEKARMQKTQGVTPTSTEVIQVEDEPQDPNGVVEVPVVNYGAERTKTKTEVSPYRQTKVDAAGKAKTMSERLKQSHGLNDTGQKVEE